MKTDLSNEQLDAELANTCAQLLKMTLTAAQAHALREGKPNLAESIGHLDEARLIVHARGHDLEIEVLAQSSLDGGTVRIFSMTANSAWTLN